MRTLYGKNLPDQCPACHCPVILLRENYLKTYSLITAQRQSCEEFRFEKNLMSRILISFLEYFVIMNIEEFIMGLRCKMYDMRIMHNHISIFLHICKQCKRRERQHFCNLSISCLYFITDNYKVQFQRYLLYGSQPFVHFLHGSWQFVLRLIGSTHPKKTKVTPFLHRKEMFFFFAKIWDGILCKIDIFHTILVNRSPFFPNLHPTFPNSQTIFC